MLKLVEELHIGLRCHLVASCDSKCTIEGHKGGSVSLWTEPFSELIFIFVACDDEWIEVDNTHTV